MARLVLLFCGMNGDQAKSDAKANEKFPRDTCSHCGAPILAAGEQHAIIAVSLKRQTAPPTVIDVQWLEISL